MPPRCRCVFFRRRDCRAAAHAAPRLPERYARCRRRDVACARRFHDVSRDAEPFRADAGCCRRCRRRRRRRRLTPPPLMPLPRDTLSDTPPPATPLSRCATAPLDSRCQILAALAMLIFAMPRLLPFEMFTCFDCRFSCADHAFLPFLRHFDAAAPCHFFRCRHDIFADFAAAPYAAICLAAFRFFRYFADTPPLMP